MTSAVYHATIYHFCVRIIISVQDYERSSVLITQYEQ